MQSSRVYYYSPDGQSAISFASVHLSLRNRVPPEVQLPVKATVCHVRACHVLKGLITDDINDGADHSFPTMTSTHFTKRSYIPGPELLDRQLHFHFLLFLHGSENQHNTPSTTVCKRYTTPCPENASFCEI